MKLGKASGPEVSMEMINASEKVGNDMMIKLCQRVLDGKGISEDWNISVMCQSKREKEMWQTAVHIEQWSYWSMKWRWLVEKG